MFSDLLLDHFQNPRNAGELPRADAVVEVSNPVCGDVLRLAARVVGGRIVEMRFLCRGCTTAIACGSILTEHVTGASLSNLREIRAEFVAGWLGGLPETTFHGAQLAEDGVKALAAALQKADSSLRSE